jgi:type IV secretory pathway TraG/TraD family ATPase VirD4
MSKNQNNSDLFTPLIEMFVELAQMFVEQIANFLGTKYREGFSKKSFSNSFKVESSMLHDHKQALGEDDLGWSVNQKGIYKFKHLSSHLHTFIIGASGWGKSNLLNILMENNFKNNRPVIFIDPKGTRESIQSFRALCQKYDRKCHVFSEIAHEMRKFNPLASMNADQALIMIMRSFDWGQKPNEYYLNASRKALKEVLDQLYSKNKEFGFADIYNELNTKHNTEETSGLRTQMHLLVNSVFGHMFNIEKETNSINFQKAWEEGTCLYLGLSTLGYGTLARTVGKMFVSELQTLAHNIGAKCETQQEAISKSIGVFIDEAGSVLYPDFIDLANKARSSGVNLTVAVQSYSDMEMVSGSETLMKQLMESFSTWFVQRQLNSENAEKLAMIFGTYLSSKTTVMMDGSTKLSKGSVREANEFYIHPNHLKEINVGQALLLTLNPKDIHLLNVRKLKVETNKSSTNQNKLAPIKVKSL